MKSLEKLRQSKPVILPSMLMCDFTDIKNECDRLTDAGSEAIHLDVMDGVFVPNMTYGIPIVEAFRKSTDMFLDVHLMIEKPEKYIKQFADAGSDLLTIHVEATEDPIGCIDLIHECGIAAGIAVNPNTDLEQIIPIAEKCELVLIMSVHAGFGGQSFIEDAIPRLKQMRDLNDSYLLEVDGGINKQTISRCADVGVDMFVVGSAIFNEEDYGSAISQLAELAETENKNA